MVMRWWLVVAAALAAVLAARAPPRPLPWRPRRDITLPQGTVRGYLGMNHFAFFGIPYAHPPTKGHRFKAPDPPTGWDGVFEATRQVKCVQASGEGEEDCLVANVFVPQGAPQCCLPVLVHVHDGGFHSGWGELHPPMRLLEEFIIVTFNYRLGALGFLCLGTPDAPGNAGLKDHIAVLYWIQQNILNFGGNSEDITLYGTGSGAISIQLLLLSGLAKGLIQRVILESGSVLSPAAMSYNPYKTALELAVSLGYKNTGDDKELVKFYKKLPIDDLITMSQHFAPCVENSLLYAHSLIEQCPQQILKEGNFEKVPMMLIYTKSEEIQIIEKNPEKFRFVPEFFEDLLPNNLKFDDEEMQYKIAETVKNFYFDEFNVDNETIVDNYKQYINDIFMDYPVFKFAVMYAARTPVPVFVMRYAPGEESGQKKAGTYGDIFKILFARDLPEYKWMTSNRLVSLWTNFIKAGDPTPITTELIPVVWETINPHGLDSVEIDRPCLLFGASISMGLPPSSQQLIFWEHIYSRFYRKHAFDGEKGDSMNE